MTERSKDLVRILAFLLLVFISFSDACPEVWTQGNWESTVYFRNTFRCDGGPGKLTVTATDSYTIYLNGTLLGSGSSVEDAETYDILAKNGDNNIAVVVHNDGSSGRSGLVVSVQVDRFRTYTSTLRTGDVWYWTDVPQTGTTWLTKKVKIGDSWSYVQLGNLKLRDVRGGFDPNAEAVWGYPGGVDTSDPESGIALSPIDGENLALGKPCNHVEVTDGLLTTGWGTQSIAALGEFASIDLQEIRIVNSVRVITKGSSPEELEENAIRGYTVSVSEDEFRWTNVAILHNITTYDQSSVSFRPIRARYVKVTISEIDGVNRPITAEIEVYGQGFTNNGSYVSPPIELDPPASLKNFGLVRWEVDVPEFTNLEIQFRAAKDTSSWGPWSEEYSSGGIWFPASEPARYFQYRVNLSTTDPEVSPRLKSISLEYDVGNIACSSALAYIEPREVTLGEETDFTYHLELAFSPSDAGVDRLAISVPSTATSVEVEGLEGGDIGEISSSQDTLWISFSKPIKLDVGSDLSLAIHFKSTVYGVSHTFHGAIFAPGSSNPLNVEENTSPGPSGEARSLSASATSIGLKGTLTEVKPRPKVISPNGDGICDYTVVEFTISKASIPRKVDIYIYDLQGRLIRHLYSGYLKPMAYTHPRDEAGARDVPGYWDGTDEDGNLVRPGTYLYRVVVQVDTGREEAAGVVTVVY